MDERQRLQSPDVEQRVDAAETLCRMGPEAAFAAVELVNACADEETVRDWAVATLEELGPPPAESLDRLSALVSAEDALVGYWAITLLGRSGSTAKPCEGNLVSALTTPGEASRRERAAWALGKIGAGSVAATRALEQAAVSAEPRLSRLAKASLDEIKA